MKPEEAGDEPQARQTVTWVQTLRSGLREQQRLQRQLAAQRAELKRDLGGKAVLIGWVATAAIADQKPTSIHPQAPGVVVHGTIVNAILTGELWRTLPRWVTSLATLAMGLLVTAAVTALSPGRGFVVSLLLAAAYLATNGLLLFDYGNVLLGIAGPVLCIGVVWAGGTMTRLIMEGVERARITRRFASYVDPQLVDFVLEHEEQDIFKGVEREMTVVFNDLAGFTALSERLGRDIVPMLNEFMGRATKVITRHHGLVNKFLGDGIMFFFNAPQPNLDYARDAVACVLDLQVMLQQFNRELADRDLPVLSLRTGASTGTMVVGDAGSAERSDYTVLGDMVNLASRLESANKAVGTSNLMTDRTVELAGDKFLFRPVGRITVVGQTVGVTVFEALAPLESATEEQKKLAELTRAMVDASIDGRPADCLEALNRMEDAFGESKLTHLYRDKCDCYLRDPSAGEFERQIVLTSK